MDPQQLEVLMRRLLTEQQVTMQSQLQEVTNRLEQAVNKRTTQLQQECATFAAETRAAEATTNASLTMLRTELNKLREWTKEQLEKQERELTDTAANITRVPAEFRLEPPVMGPELEGYGENVPAQEHRSEYKERIARLKDANIKLQLPEGFSGEKGAKTLSWILQVEEFAKDWGLRLDDCLPIAKQLLKSNAQNWLQAYLKAVYAGRKPAISTWETFRQLLLSEFPEPDTEWTATMKLLTPSVKQGNRSAHEYVAEMRSYFSDAGNSFNETTRMNLFWAGLNRGLRTKLDAVMQLQPILTLEQMFAKAQNLEERFEISQLLDKQLTPGKPRTVPIPTQTQTTAMVPRPLPTRTQTSVNSPGPTPMELGSLYCKRCKRKGHSLEKCWFAHPELRPAWFGKGGQKPNANVNKQGARVHNLSLPDNEQQSQDDSSQQENC